MHIILRFRKAISGLHGKLTLTYTLTTALALLALELVVLGALFVTYIFTNNDADHYLDDIYYTLMPQARGYLDPNSVIQPDKKSGLEAGSSEPDIAGLQAWVEFVYASGYASSAPSGPMDSPAAPIDKGYGLYVLDLQGRILAATPTADPSNHPGQIYNSPIPDFPGFLSRAGSSELSTWAYSRLPNGSYLLELPVRTAPPPDGSTEQLGYLIVVAVKPAQPFYTLLPVVLSGLGIIVLTGLGLLAAAAPFGALFGFVMARGLTRRLASLSEAATAWSEGDFSIQPQDNSRDEIGALGLRLRTMAERVQNLLESRDELALLQERNRLARDLHDTVKQQTFSALMQMRAAKNLAESDPAAARQAIDAAETLLKTAQHDLALIIAELRPAALDAQGLPAALTGYLPQWSQNAGIQAELHVQGERALPLEKEQTLFRLVQEALSNVARHSHATRVDLNLDYNSSQVSLQIKDNGQGFDPEAQQRTGYGLQSMEQRARSVGGELTVQSSPGLGTRVQANIPLEKGQGTV